MARPTAAAAAIIALLAGCGGDDGGGDGTAPTRTVAAGKTVRVVAKEYSFDPENLSVASGRVRLALDNEGALAHNLKVLKGGEELGGTPTFTAGQTRAGLVALRPGRYEIVCTVGDHAQLGMRGTLLAR